jgi:acetyl esterase/lipase
METITYKRIGDIELKLDVHLPEMTASPPPVAILIHGGALILGSRDGIIDGLATRLLDAGVVVVSPDYRLAPETKLPEIWSDIEDVFAWVRESGPALFGIDPERIGVHGKSAGGYLALMSGCRIKPPPRVVAAYAGYASLTGPWYLQPDPWYCSQEPIEETYARSTVGLGIPTDGNTGMNRSAYYTYLRQNGLWSSEVGGMSVEALRNYCPIDLASKAYPPALLYHGNADHDVPFSESENFAAKLDALGVEHRFLPLEGVDHIFEGASEKDVEHVHEQTAAFMLGRLKMM